MLHLMNPRIVPDWMGKFFFDIKASPLVSLLKVLAKKKVEMIKRNNMKSYWNLSIGPSSTYKSIDCLAEWTLFAVRAKESNQDSESR